MKCKRISAFFVALNQKKHKHRTSKRTMILSGDNTIQKILENMKKNVSMTDDVPGLDVLGYMIPVICPWLIVNIK